jgi:hypothetical protein
MDAASESAAGPAPSVAVIVTPPGAIPVTLPKKLTRARVSWLLPQVTTIEKSRWAEKPVKVQPTGGSSGADSPHAPVLAGEHPAA